MSDKFVVFVILKQNEWFRQKFGKKRLTDPDPNFEVKNDTSTTYICYDCLMDTLIYKNKTKKFA